MRRAVVDAGAGELLEPGLRHPPVGHARRHEDELALSRPPPVSCTIRPAPSTFRPMASETVEELGAEPAGLVGGAPGQVGAREPGGEAEVVLDRLDCPACPPGASRSTITVRSPSEAPYTAAASPAGPPPTMARS